MPKRKPKPAKTTIVIIESTEDPEHFSLFRSADSGQHYIWCGPAGWLEYSAYAWEIRAVSLSMREAEEEALRAAKVPL